MNDFRYAFRQLRKNPGFTVVATLTLALGIGATTLVFSIVNGVLLKPLDYPEPDRIVQIWETDAESGGRKRTSPAVFTDWQAESRTFEAMAIYAEYSGYLTRSFIYSGDGAAERLKGHFVSADLFKVFGIKPISGREFLPEDDQAGAARVVILSHETWDGLFARDPDIIGRSITLENQGRHSYQVVGVMPPGFHYPAGSRLWVPTAHMPIPMTRRGGSLMRAIGRVKPGVPIEAAQMELSGIQGRVHEEYGHLGERHGRHVAIGNQIRLESYHESIVRNVRASLYVFSGAVLFVLLIACANVANLLLARALSRQKEVAVRAALGAGRWRIVRQLLTESLTLSLSGAALGSLLAYWGLKLVILFNAGTIPRINEAVLDWRALAFAAAVSIVTGLIFGLAPAWRASRADFEAALKEGSQRVAGGVANARLSGMFTVAQVSLALVLLIGAGLLTRSFLELQAVETGYDTEEVLTVHIDMTGAAHANVEQRRLFFRDLTERMREVPGVEAACGSSTLPDRGNGWPTAYWRLDRPAPQQAKAPRVSAHCCTPEFLKTYGIGLLKGREFTEADSATAPRVMIINQAFANLLFLGEDPVGKQIHCGGVREIVGVMADIKNSSLARETRPMVYMSYQQWEFPWGFLTVRAKGDLAALAPIITKNVRKLNPEQPLAQFESMASITANATARPRFRSMLLGFFALAALVLASVGIYGVMAYSVTQRTHEMGIRMALGAEKSDVMTIVLRQGLKLTLLGVAIGLAGSMALTRVLENQLFGVTPTDTSTFIGVSAALVVAALAACVAPAWRAARTHPMTALRHE